jgi:hypothetical protein
MNERPFEPFVARLIDGREITVPHQDYVVPAYGGLGLWLIHDTGQVEGIDGSLIAWMRTLHPVDPHRFTG